MSVVSDVESNTVGEGKGPAVPPLIAELRKTCGELSEFLEPFAYRGGLNLSLEEFATQLLNRNLLLSCWNSVCAALSEDRVYEIMEELLSPLVGNHYRVDIVSYFIRSTPGPDLISAVLSPHCMERFCACLDTYQQQVAMQSGIHDVQEGPYGYGSTPYNNDGMYRGENGNRPSYHPRMENGGSHYNQYDFMSNRPHSSYIRNQYSGVNGKSVDRQGLPVDEEEESFRPRRGGNAERGGYGRGRRNVFNPPNPDSIPRKLNPPVNTADNADLAPHHHQSMSTYNNNSSTNNLSKGSKKQGFDPASASPAATGTEPIEAAIGSVQPLVDELVVPHHSHNFSSQTRPRAKVPPQPIENVNSSASTVEKAGSAASDFPHHGNVHNSQVHEYTNPTANSVLTRNHHTVQNVRKQPMGFNNPPRGGKTANPPPAPGQRPGSAPSAESLADPGPIPHIHHQIPRSTTPSTPPPPPPPSAPYVVHFHNVSLTNPFNSQKPAGPAYGQPVSVSQGPKASPGNINAPFPARENDSGRQQKYPVEGNERMGEKYTSYPQGVESSNSSRGWMSAEGSRQNQNSTPGPRRGGSRGGRGGSYAYNASAHPAGRQNSESVNESGFDSVPPEYSTDEGQSGNGESVRPADRDNGPNLGYQSTLNTNRGIPLDEEGSEEGIRPSVLRKRGTRGFGGRGRGRGSQTAREENTPCKFHSVGNCRFGDSCRHAHADTNIQSVP